MTPNQFVARQLKKLRNRAGMTNAQLGAAAHYSTSLGWAMEGGNRAVQLDTARGIDTATHAGGWFAELVEFLSTQHNWYRDYVTLERRATAIFAWEPRVIHGLLQTEAYARAMIARMTPKVTPGDWRPRSRHGWPASRRSPARTYASWLMRNPDASIR